MFSDPAMRLLAEKPIRWASGNHCTSVVCLSFPVENSLLGQSHGDFSGLFLLELWQTFCIISFKFSRII